MSERRGSRLSNHKFIEFFSGIGLVHEAIAPLGWSAVLANDICEKKNRTYSANFPAVPVTAADVRELNLRNKKLPDVRLATASFPCIDISQAGGRLGIQGPKSSVVWAFLDRVQELSDAGNRPDFLFLENVPGLLYHHEGRDIDILLQRITALGYAVDAVQVDARNFTPQTRNRVFVIAVCQSLGLPTYRGSAAPSSHIRRYRAAEVYARNVELPWLFFDFPSLPQSGLNLSDIVQPMSEDDDRWWDAEQMEYFWERLEHDHRPRLREAMESGKPAVMTAMRRGRRRGLREQIINIRWDGLASCLRTPKGGSSTQFIVQVRDGQVRVRKILAVEAARLQGVRLPKQTRRFILPKTESEALFGLGDAVCVPVVQWVFKHSIQSIVEATPLLVPNQAQLPMVVNL